MSSYHASGPCHRCGRGGHLARECSLHICFRCNGLIPQKETHELFPGCAMARVAAVEFTRGHMAWECVEGVTCSRCGERGHLQRNCKNVSCHKCGRKGHISKFCNDPFIKAEEVERHERQQALLKSRNASGQGSGKGGLTSLTRSVATPAGRQRVAPGPWDGLGNPGQDRMLTETDTSSIIGFATGKLGTDRSHGSMSVINVKILSVKRKIYPEVNMQRAKRLAHQNFGDQEANIGGDPMEIAPCDDTLKDEETPQWNGLLGYGSGDSRDDCHASSDADSEEPSFSCEEHV